eukprot:GHVL01025602.1.p1 GENE.GHVL01025602.1~~GHVL01025602.1.p1  ORF type:complete len:229 (+),score=44.95 GHVL01025602.1:133-819(+)
MTDSDDGCDCCSPNCDPIDGFQCPTRNSRNHTYCHECGDCLPLRLDLLQDRKINCDICGLNYCTPYRTSCPAQINSVNLLNTIWIIKLKDAKLGSILTSKWLLNSAERGIYDAYLSSNSTTIQDIYNNSISQNKGVLNTPYFRNLMQIKNLRIVPNNEILGVKDEESICINCCSLFVGAVLYQHRASIKKDLTYRDQCWYGRECKTQHRPDGLHAAKLDHICENTKNI